MNKTALIAFAFFAMLTNELMAQEIDGFKKVDPSAAGFSVDRLERLDQWISSMVEQNVIAGATVIISRKGKLAYSESFGKSNVDSQRDMTTNDLFKIASMSKVITSVAVLQMYEKGLFLLDDPISKYITELEKMEVLSSFNEADSTFTTVPSKTPTTIRHLLTHTSGISYGGEKISKIKAKQGIDDISMFSNTLEQFVMAISKVPLAHQPGESWTYGYSTDILGYLIEKISGKSLSDYLETNLFIPLGMSSTGFNISNDDYSRYVQLYGSKGGKLIPIMNPKHHLPKDKKVTLFMGGSGLVSSPEDYMRFAQMLHNGGKFNGKRIIGKKTIELMTTNQIDTLNYPEDMLRLLGTKNKFGLGVNVVTESGSKNELYSAGSYYWEGMYATSFIVDPKEDLVAVFMIQIGTRKPLREKFRLMLYQALD